MFNKKSFRIPIGSFLKLSEKKFVVNDQIIYIGERKKELEKKPKKYLFTLQGGFNYISSLYPVDENHYYIDDYNQRYFLTDYPDHIEIDCYGEMNWKLNPPV